MEMYDVTLIDLNTQEELSVRIEVDEGETTENIVISAIMNKLTRNQSKLV